MKIINTLILFACIAVFTSCNDDDSMAFIEVESKTISNLHAPQTGGQGQGPISGEFTKFDFETGAVTNSNTDWDIAFRGTTIIVNGGVSLANSDEPERTGNAAAYIANATFSALTEVDVQSFKQDSESESAIPKGGGNGWYNYIPFPQNLITPIPGRILVFRTTEGNYAKVEILSYYKDAPENPDSTIDEARYYTFNYVYQPNKGVTTF